MSSLNDKCPRRSVQTQHLHGMVAREWEPWVQWCSVCCGFESSPVPLALTGKLEGITYNRKNPPALWIQLDCLVTKAKGVYVLLRAVISLKY